MHAQSHAMRIYVQLVKRLLCVDASASTTLSSRLVDIKNEGLWLRFGAFMMHYFLEYIKSAGEPTYHYDGYPVDGPAYAPPRLILDALGKASVVHFYSIHAYVLAYLDVTPTAIMRMDPPCTQTAAAQFCLLVNRRVCFGVTIIICVMEEAMQM